LLTVFGFAQDVRALVHVERTQITIEMIGDCCVQWPFVTINWV
jgi:hypothetical protein